MSKNKLYLFFVLFFMLVIPLSFACDFENEDCNYEEIDWSQVEDFTYVDLSNEHINWGEVILSRIEDEKVSEIPIQHFDPKEILEHNLFYASVEQIKGHLLDFENLAFTNPDYLSQVFLDEFSVDITFRDNQEIVFDGTFLSGDFSSYKPEDFPQQNYKQIIDDGVVKIIPLDNEGNELPDDAFSVKGAEKFTKDEDGNLNLVLGDDEAILDGIQKGKVTFDDGTIIEYENNENGKFTFSSNGDFSSTDGEVKIDYVDKEEPIELKGRFDKTNGIYNLEPYNGRQSVYIDNNFPETPLSVGTRGEKISIYTDGEEHEGNYVSYLDDIYRLNGAGALYTHSFQVQSNNKDSYFEEVDGKTKAKGILKYNNENLIYDGLCETAIFTREVIDGEEIVDVDANNDLEDAIVARITKTNLKYAHLIEEDFINNANNMVFDIQRKNNKLDIEYDLTSIGRLTEVYDDPYAFLLLNKGLKINIADTDISMTINPDLGVVYNDGVNEPVNIISPERSFHLTGTDLEILTNIVETVIEEKNDNINVHELGLQRMYEMRVNSFNNENPDEYFEKVYETFNEIRDFISENYDDFSKDIMLTSFILENVDGLIRTTGIDFNYFEDNQHVSELYGEIKDMVYGNPIISEFLDSSTEINLGGSDWEGSGEGVGNINQVLPYSDLSILKESLDNLIQENPENIEYYKGLLESQLINLINYEKSSLEFDIDNYMIGFSLADYDSVGVINDAYEVNVGQTREQLIYERLKDRNNEGIINVYRALLFLEDLKTENDELNLEPSFSENKMFLTEKLIGEYLNNNNQGQAISLYNRIEDEWSNSGEDDINIDLFMSNFRKQIFDSASNRILTDLTKVGTQIRNLLSDREGAINKIKEAEGVAETVKQLIFAGGYGTDLARTIGVFSDSIEKLEHLSDYNKKLLEGNLALNQFFQNEVPKDLIYTFIEGQGSSNQAHNRIREEVMAHLILNNPDSFEVEEDFEDWNWGTLGDGTSGYIFRMDHDNNQASFVYNDKKYIVNMDIMDQVDSLTSHNAAEGAHYLIHESEFSGDYRILFGEETIVSSEDYIGHDLKIDNYSPLEQLSQDLKEEFGFNMVQNVLTNIDASINPASIAISAATGGIGSGTALTFARNTGITLGRFVAIDAGIGAIDYGITELGLDETNFAHQMGITFAAYSMMKGKINPKYISLAAKKTAIKGTYKATKYEL